LVGEPLERLLPREVLPHEGLVELHDLRHSRLDLRQILGRQRVSQVEVVIETVVDRRTDGELRAGEEVAQRLRHHMCGRVAKNVKPIGVRRKDG
jgi:hypothetical protein